MKALVLLFLIMPLIFDSHYKDLSTPSLRGKRDAAAA